MTQTAVLADNTKVLVQYVTDRNLNVAIKIPHKYLAASKMVLVSATNNLTYSPRPDGMKPRFFWLNALDANGKLVRRKLIYNAATPPDCADGTTVANIDGFTFRASGHVGEKQRAAVNAT